MATNPTGWCERSQQAVEDAKSWDDARIAETVRRVVFEVGRSADASEELVGLQSLGPRTHGTVLEILRDPELRSRLVQPTGRSFRGSETPFNRLCELIKRDPPVEAVELMAPFLDDSTRTVRQDAAQVLGSFGNDAAIPSVAKALREVSDSDFSLSRVASSALHGIDSAVRGRRVSTAFRHAIFEEVVPLLWSSRQTQTACEVLLDLDRDRALLLFLDERFLTPESPSLDQALDQLNKKGILVPRDRLLGLIIKLSSPEIKYPQTYQLRECLRAIGRHRLEEDRPLLDSMTSHPDATIAEGAAEGLLASHGLDNFYDRIAERLRTGGVQALNAHQRHYFGVYWLDIEVNNGGVHQYFSNSAGDNWRSALEGLDEMGLLDHAAVLRDAVSRFGPDGPSVDRGQRNEQLDAINEDVEWWFETFDKRLSACAANVKVMVLRYILAHSDAFR